MPEPAIEVEPPVCGRCGGLIRPDIVWFGEALPEGPWQRAVEATQDADVMVVVGTSAIVYPAAGLPELGAGPRRGRDRGQPGAHAAVRKCHDQHPRTASQALPGLLQRLPALLK